MLNIEKLVRYLVLPIWALIILATLFFLNTTSSKAFDPYDSLFAVSKDVNFDLEFSQIISTHIQDHTRNLVIHFSNEPACLCQFISSTHIQRVKSLAESQNKRNIDIQLKNNHRLAKIIPSFPSIAVFNAQGKLAYLGPYSIGIGCISGRGSVEPFIKQTSAFGAVINLEANGCYCS